MPASAPAQRGVSNEGALFLLLPLGARNTATGQSVAAPEPGSEQLYWNPAGIARAAKREIALNAGRFFVGPLVAVASVYPIGRAGVIGGGISVLSYGSQETGDINGPSGTISQQSYVFAATYAATLGPRASLGFTFKNARFVGTCSGLCPPLATFDVSSSAIDVGVQYRLRKDDDLVVALAVRHAGLRFQLNDEPQSDPLPTRVQIGASARVYTFSGDLAGATLRANADVIDRATHLGDAAPRLGVEFAWKGELAVRAGYVAGTGEGTGFGVGFGVVTGRLSLDLARTLSGSGDASGGSTYFSLRHRW